MQVHNIQSNNYTRYNSPKFGALYLPTTRQTLLDIYHLSEESLRKIDIWKNELKATKNFDLYMHEGFNELWMAISSNNYFYPDCKAPLYVFDEPENNALSAYGIDIFDCDDADISNCDNRIWYPLKFSSHEDAINAYNTLKKYQDNKDTCTIDDEIAWAVDSVKILEKGTEHMTKHDVTKVQDKPEIKSTELTLWQRFKNVLSGLFK